LTHVFCVPGGLVDPFLPDLSSPETPTAIVAAHEGGAVAMADGYARASGSFGAAFVIGGPGILNTTTMVAAAATDGSPLLIVSGQVPTDVEGRGAFQDSSATTLDDVAVLEPLTLRSVAIENPHLVEHHLRVSLARMLAGARGPVHLSMPTDIQHSEVHVPWVPLDTSSAAPVDMSALNVVWDRLVTPTPATKIAIYAGAGVEASDAAPDLLAVAQRYSIPVATTLRGKGVFPESHELSLGIFGYAGHRPALDAILGEDLEVLIVIGSGLSQRDTMFWNRDMLPSRTLVHIDTDADVLHRTFRTETPVVADAGAALRALLAADDERSQAFLQSADRRRDWIRTVREAGPRRFDADTVTSDAVPIHPARVVAELQAALPSDAIVVTDSGAHRAFWAHHWVADQPRTYLTAANLGPMGWAIPAGVGAQAARPDRRVVVVTGDGCMLMHGIEIQTAARYGLPVIFLVVNNSALGNVYLRAKTAGPGPREMTILPTHDYAGFARSLGLQAATVEDPDDLARALAAAVAADAPYLVDVRCGRDYTTPVQPWTAARARWHDDD
jgi:acetolactate synthase-1/2/3 large subunit